MRPHRCPPLKALTASLALLASTGCHAADSTARHALLIGISDYAASGLPALPGSRQDVTLMRDVLLSRLGFQPREIRVLLDQEATHTGMRQAFAALAQQVKPGDLVYVHYSGHGSLVKDVNDQERTGWDQTLVGYGARQSGRAGLDRYDILDDEVNHWLAPIAETAGELVFVADACHSATNTRGPDALVTRAAPPDVQDDRPLAHAPGQRSSLGDAIRIGGARDDQSAQETVLEDGRQAGVFTWNWARALQQAEPTDTWRRVFDRASLWVSLSQGSAQNPQLTGCAADRQILGGRLDSRPAVLVREVRGATAILDTGRLSGLTTGSLFVASETSGAVLVRIRETQASWSRGEIVSGTLAPGAFLVEREHVYETPPLQLFALPALSGRDQALLDQLRTRLDQLTGFVWTNAQSEATLVLAVLRPRRANGKPQYRETSLGRATLPVEDADAAPEIWVLTPGEQLVHEHLITRLAPATEGFERLARNLDRYRRMVELRRLTAEGGHGAGINLGLIQFEPCQPPATGCFQMPMTGAWFRRTAGTLPIEQLGQRPQPTGALISFRLENVGRRARYTYLFEIAPDGTIRLIFPAEDKSEAVAQLKAGERRELPDEDIGLVLDAPGDAALLVLATQRPLDPRFLTQPGYEPSPEAIQRGEANPLERLLVGVAQTRGTPATVSIGTGSWEGTLIDYQVEPSGNR